MSECLGVCDCCFGLISGCLIVKKKKGLSNSFSEVSNSDAKSFQIISKLFWIVWHRSTSHTKMATRQSKKNTILRLARETGVAATNNFLCSKLILPSLQLRELALTCYLLMGTDTKLVITLWESLERGWHQVTSSRWQNNFQVEHRPSRARNWWVGGLQVFSDS